MGVPPTNESGWGRITYLWDSVPFVYLLVFYCFFLLIYLYISDINWISFSLGVGSLLMFILLREIKKKFPRFIPLKLIPSVLIAVGVAILLSWTLDFEAKGVPVLGEIPR